MARLSRVLSAVGLGIAMTAAVGAAVVAVEYNPAHRSPTHLAQSDSSARVIVKFKERASILSATTANSASTAGPQKAGVLGARLGLALTDGRILGARTQVMSAKGMTSAALASTIAADGDVEWAQVDHRRFVQAAPVNDPLYPDNLNNLSTVSGALSGPVSGQWYLRAPGTDASGHYLASSINVEPAWAITHGATTIVIGDVDTGITAHPDLDSKMLTGYDFISDVATANDGDGRDSNPSDPGDYVTAIENSTKGGDFFGCNDNGTGGMVAENSSWHGTQTAGILGAATNNSTGMAGTGYNTQVIAARALGKCGGSDSDIIAAAQWLGGIHVDGVPDNTHPVRVINMSLGGTGNCATDAPAYIDALTTLRNSNVVVVAAAGNDEGLALGVPANCKPDPSDTNQTPIIIAVAGLRQAGDKVGFSDIGPEVTISAPAGNCINTTSGSQCLYPILTTANSGTTTPVTNGGIYTDGLQSPSLGTSFATPLVSGTVALMLAAAPNLDNQQVINILQSTARPFPTTSDTVPTPATCTAPTTATQDECICTTSTCGAGMLDAGRAVAAAAALSTGAATSYTAPTAVVAPTSTSVVVGSTVTLSGAGSTVGSSGAALTYQWSIPDGDTFITLGSTTGASVVVTGAAAGTGQVQLIVTDPTSGLTSTATVSVTVTSAASSSGGGGGGAANPAWLVALAVAGLLLRPRVRRPRA